MVNIETLENKVKKLNAELDHFRNIESNEKSINEMKEQVEICEELVDEFEQRIEVVEKKHNKLEETYIKEKKVTDDKISNLKEQTDNKINALDGKIENIGGKLDETNNKINSIDVYNDSEIKRNLLEQKTQLKQANLDIKNIEKQKADKEHKHVIDDIEGLPAFLNNIKTTGPVAVGGYTKGVRSIVAGPGITIDETDPRHPIVNATGGGSSGDVVGPAGATNGNIALYDGATGKLIKNSTYSPASFAPALTSDENYVTDAQLVVIGNTSGTNTGDQDLSVLVPYTGATADLNLGTYDVITDTLRASTSAGLLIESANGTDVGLLGAGNTANIAWYGNHNYSTATQDTIAIFTGAGKTLGSASTATYPSLAELAYVKGVTSAIQTQINAKQPNIQFKDEGTNAGTAGGVTIVDFVGAGVTASETAGTLTVTIPGGGSSGINIWYSLTGTYASASTFTFSGDAGDAEAIERSLFTCLSSADARKIGYVKSASHSAGTVTVTVVTDIDLASGDKTFKVAINRKIEDYQHLFTVPGEQIADASNPQGMFYRSLIDTYLLPVNSFVRTAAAGSGAACAWNIYKGATNLFTSAQDMTTSATFDEKRPNTNTISAGDIITLRVTSSAGATNKASDLQVQAFIVPQTLYTTAN